MWVSENMRYYYHIIRTFILQADDGGGRRTLLLSLSHSTTTTQHNTPSHGFSEFPCVYGPRRWVIEIYVMHCGSGFCVVGDRVERVFCENKKNHQSFDIRWRYNDLRNQSRHQTNDLEIDFYLSSFLVSKFSVTFHSSVCCESAELWFLPVPKIDPTTHSTHIHD